MPLFYDTWPLPQGHQRLSTVPKIIETGEFVALGTSISCRLETTQKPGK